LLLPAASSSPLPFPSPPQQDTIVQLHNQLKSSDALLNQNHGAIAAVLLELDPMQHSLGFLYLL
jgi:hypothetical protein